MTQPPPTAELSLTLEECAIFAQIVALLEASRRERLAAQKCQTMAIANHLAEHPASTDSREGTDLAVSVGEVTYE